MAYTHVPTMYIVGLQVGGEAGHLPQARRASKREDEGGLPSTRIGAVVVRWRDASAVVVVRGATGPNSLPSTVGTTPERARELPPLTGARVPKPTRRQDPHSPRHQ